ncbi:hypothetical protein M9Y10_019689 [Tritrichomonas musculus]|uniref:Uncharacterized protein n=1 Tax=Tritrichomonas musculus TaxID=1915356 RepID=A0ABR2HH12_9EUKA
MQIFVKKGIMNYLLTSSKEESKPKNINSIAASVIHSNDDQVCPAKYATESNSEWVKNYFYFKIRAIQGSHDKNDWVTIDEQRKLSQIDGKGLVHLFDVSYKINETLRCIRLLIIGTEMIFSYLTILNYLEDLFNFSKT